MRHSEFLKRVPDELRLKLPTEYRDFQWRVGGHLVKVFYGRPGIHYEAWLRSNGLLELGLHFEADKATNDRLLRLFSEQALEVVGQLGPQVEIEEWTKTWGRVHQTLPYATPDEELLAQAVERLAAMICVLQPMMEQT